MTGSSWAAAAVVLLHLNSVGALPKEVPVTEVSARLAAQPIRVLIDKNATSIIFRPDATGVIENADTGEQLAGIATGEQVTVTHSRDLIAIRTASTRSTGTHLLFRPVSDTANNSLTSRGGWGTHGAYPGALEFRLNGGLTLIEHIDLESYTAGVVTAEVPKNFPREAMKAQAIAARTYTLFHLDDHLAEGADLCRQVHCHAFAGVPESSTRAYQAVMDTAGELLVYNGLLIDAQYSAACGGHTVAAWETRQGKLLPYLSGADDTSLTTGRAFCAADHTVTWSKSFSYAEANKLITQNLKTVLGDSSMAVGKLRSLRVAERNGSRVKWLEVITTTGVYRVMGDSIRWLFGVGIAGPRGLRSTRFDLVVRKNSKGAPQSFYFTGRGHGHGIGLCQWGARGRALAGQTAEEILAAYYPGTVLEYVSTHSLVSREPPS